VTQVAAGEGEADDHGREPLLTTSRGRLQKGTIRKYVYAWTRPCATGKDCPFGEDPDTCEAAQRNNAAYQCPESLSPHPLRRGYITHLRANGVPTEDVISERSNANLDVVEHWYDVRYPPREGWACQWTLALPTISGGRRELAVRVQHP
jgi:hypothetical protein